MLEVKFKSNIKEVIEKIADHAMVGYAPFEDLDVVRRTW